MTQRLSIVIGWSRWAFLFEGLFNFNWGKKNLKCNEIKEKKGTKFMFLGGGHDPRDPSDPQKKTSQNGRRQVKMVNSFLQVKKNGE